MNSFDFFLENLPLIGIYFERMASFWRENIALANITHIVLGAGVALFLFSEWKKTGITLVILSLLIHVIPFLI